MTGTSGYACVHENGYWKIFKVVGAVFTTLNTPFAQALSSGLTYKVKFQAVGSTLKYWTDNADGVYVLRDTVTDSSLTAAGEYGFYLAATGISGTYIDSLQEVATDVVASAILVSGPTTGQPAAASTSFTVSANGPIAGTVVVTPGYTGNAGTFTPTSVSISSGSPTGTFTFTPATVGTSTLSVTNNGGLSNPASSSYVASVSPATAVTMSGPTSGTTGAVSSNFTIEANGSITGTVVVTPSDAGAGGTFTPTSVSISSGTPTGTFVYTAASNGTKTISVANNGGLSNPSNISYTAAAATALTSGLASLTSATNTTINLSCTAATGGTNPLTYQWYRSTSATFTVGAGTLLSGATSLTLADTTALVADTIYFYVCRVTDAVAATADSRRVAGVLKSAPLNIGFIGDSITYGQGLSAGQSPPDQIAGILTKLYKNRVVNTYNQAHGGASTADWLSGSSYLTTAKSAFSAGGVAHVHIMLGVNDAVAAAGISAAQFKANLQNILADLTGAGYIVILSYPTFHIVGASGIIDATYVDKLASYKLQIDSVINGTNVLRGDVLACEYFVLNQSEYSGDNVHPNSTGALSLAQMWARAIDRALYSPDRPVPTRTVTCTFANKAGTPQASLTGLKWQWSDVAGSVIDSGTGATTNASGVFSITVHSYLTPGSLGFLQVTNAAGVANTTYLSFAGPAAVS